MESPEKVSSYQKGINRLLEHQEVFEKLIIEYLLNVNSRFRSNMFPTPQIGKVLLDKLKLKRTQFPIIHKIVRTILAEWNRQGWCEYVTTTKSGRNRRTKFIYKFNPDNIQFLKGRYISSSISEIEKDITLNKDEPLLDMMKSRETILGDWLESFVDVIDNIDTNEAEPEDMDAINDLEEDKTTNI